MSDIFKVNLFYCRCKFWYYFYKKLRSVDSSKTETYFGVLDDGLRVLRNLQVFLLARWWKWRKRRSIVYTTGRGEQPLRTWARHEPNTAALPATATLAPPEVEMEPEDDAMALASDAAAPELPSSQLGEQIPCFPFPFPFEGFALVKFVADFN